jgi:CheY-like chemotaxis protein
MVDWCPGGPRSGGGPGSILGRRVAAGARIRSRGCMMNVEREGLFGRWPPPGWWLRALDPSRPDPETGECIMSRRWLVILWTLSLVLVILATRVRAEEVRRDQPMDTATKVAIWTGILGAAAPIVLGLGKLIRDVIRLVLDYRYKAKQIPQSAVQGAANEGKIEGLVELVNRGVAAGLIRPLPNRPALIIEDDEWQGRIYAKAMLLRGYLADMAASVSVAREKLRAKYYELVLLDPNLGSERADALVGEIKARNPRCRVFVVSGEADSPRIAALEAVADAYFAKPLDLDDLEDRLKMPVE